MNQSFPRAFHFKTSSATANPKNTTVKVTTPIFTTVFFVIVVFSV